MTGLKLIVKVMLGYQISVKAIKGPADASKWIDDALEKSDVKRELKRIVLNFENYE